MHRLWFAKASWVVLISVLVALLAAAACGGDATPTPDTAADEAAAAAAKEAAAAELSEEFAALRAKLRPIQMSRFADSGTDMLIYIVDKILTDEMGYKTETLTLSSKNAYVALHNGDIDVSVNLWPETQAAFITEYVDEKGTVEILSRMGFRGKNMALVPTFVIEGDSARGIEPLAPDLKTWEDLEKYKELFAVAETSPKGRFLGVEVGWGDWPERFEAMGLDDDYDIQYSGGEAAMLAELDAAVRKGEPLLFYGYLPHFMFSKWDLTEIELPPQVEGCEVTTFFCGHPTVQPAILGHVGFKVEFPVVHQFFQNINNITDLDHAEMLLTVDEGASVEESAQAWMDRNEDKWMAWIP